VGALSDPDTITNYSQHGPYIVKYPSPDIIPKPDLTAPGCGKIVSVGKFKDYFCGTSAAAPQVAGVLALLKSADVPGNRQMLYKTAVDLGPEGRDNIYGHGRVDAAAAGALMIHDEPPTVDRLDAFTVTAGESHDGTLTGTLSNAAAEAGLTLTFKVTDKPEHGTLSLDADSGAFTYAADSGYSGQDSFKFVASDGLLQSGEQTGHATVKRQSTTDPGPDPDPKPKPPTSGGGGGFGWLALLPLGFAIGLRRRYGGKTA
jgi:subtilisin family serine protease